MSAPSLAGARALVLGLGRFGGGLGAARWLLSQGARVTVTDRLPREALVVPATELERAGARLVLGGHEGVDLASTDLLVVNPAVPLSAPLVRAARAAGVPVTSEIALLLERWPGPVLGVTGSNGKSTTVCLAKALLSAAGVEAWEGGNLGGSLLPRLATAGPRTAAVLELSSFMLELLPELGLGPDVAIVLNVTPNHLDRHGTMDAYTAAKAGILVRARAAVLNADDPRTSIMGLGRPLRALRFGVAGRDRDLGVDPAGHLVDASGRRVVASSEVPLPGRMNRVDLAAAILAAGELLDDRERVLAAVPAALSGFRPPAHRLQLVDERLGVRWIDDSVSTTPESTAASLEAIGGPCLLVAGGHDKGLDPRPLLDAARGRARIVLTVGEQGGPLAMALNREGIPAEQVHTVEAAVLRAARLARVGDTVLLSPGYSSHDQFANYEARAEAFARAVARLALSPPAEEC
ncbi:MAG: UDP-N-acetylmuramoyl-L-alanine--D-glutamate ligase [Planctomycetes bacterium]|nr:UDP-N-acetylmuramoyl-L-alanine--D-glutamate ligase [Planctomycetota bacterium]